MGCFVEHHSNQMIVLSHPLLHTHTHTHTVSYTHSFNHMQQDAVQALLSARDTTAARASAARAREAVAAAAVARAQREVLGAICMITAVFQQSHGEDGEQGPAADVDGSLLPIMQHVQGLAAWLGSAACAVIATMIGIVR